MTDQTVPTEMTPGAVVVLEATYGYDGMRVIGAGEYATLRCTCGHETPTRVRIDREDEPFVECDVCDRAYSARVVGR